jgi:predicted nucleotidyltransferase component of viral defense system
LEAGSYPTSSEEVAAWRKANQSTLEEARRRFVQFVVLASISMVRSLASRIVFKGGNALQFVHGNVRSTADLDFTAEADFPDDKREITRLLNAAFKAGLARYRVRLRCQSIERKPPGLDNTMPTYRIKACFQMPGDRYYQNFDERKTIPEVVELEISLNDVLCETMEKTFSANSSSVRVCTLEDIVAEKLRALLQQVPRRRSRPQDAFDIASMTRLRGDLDLAKVSAFVTRKSEARAISPKKSSYDATVRELARKGYDDLIKPEMARYISFDDAWQEVLSLVHRLAIPD